MTNEQLKDYDSMSFSDTDGLSSHERLPAVIKRSHCSQKSYNQKSSKLLNNHIHKFEHKYESKYVLILQLTNHVANRVYQPKDSDRKSDQINTFLSSALTSQKLSNHFRFD